MQHSADENSVAAARRDGGVASDSCGNSASWFRTVPGDLLPEGALEGGVPEGGVHVRPDLEQLQRLLPGPPVARGAAAGALLAGCCGGQALGVEAQDGAGAGSAELVVLLRRRRRRRRRPAADGRRRLRQRDPLTGPAGRREWRRHLHLLCAELLRWASTTTAAASSSSPVLLLLHANSSCSRAGRRPVLPLGNGGDETIST